MTTTTEKPVSVRGRYQYQYSIGLLSASEAGFSDPVSIALGPDDLLYVLNRGNPNQPEAVRVTICTKDSDYVDQFGTTGTGDGQFLWPTAIAFNSRWELFLADEALHRISVFDRHGKFLYSFGQEGSGPGQLNRPSGLAVDREGSLLVVDGLNHRVQKLTPGGDYLSSFGSFGSGAAQFNLPWGIALDGQGSIYVTDWRNDRVQQFTSQGQFIRAFGKSGAGDGEFNRPNGITVDQEGDIYVCDWRNDRVQVFNSAGQYQDTLTGHCQTSRWAKMYLDANPEVEQKLNQATQNIPIKMRFYRPTSVAVDGDGRVFVVDCYRHRVQIYQKL